MPLAKVSLMSCGVHSLLTICRSTRRYARRHIGQQHDPCNEEAVRPVRRDSIPGMTSVLSEIIPLMSGT